MWLHVCACGAIGMENVEQIKGHFRSAGCDIFNGEANVVLLHDRKNVNAILNGSYNCLLQFEINGKSHRPRIQPREAVARC